MTRKPDLESDASPSSPHRRKPHEDHAIKSYNIVLSILVWVVVMLFMGIVVLAS